MTEIPGFYDFIDTEFLAIIDGLLADKASRLVVTSQDIFHTIDNTLLNTLLKHHLGPKPSWGVYVLKSLTSGPSWDRWWEHNTKTIDYIRKGRHHVKAAPEFTLSRATIGFTDKERAMFAGMAALRAQNKLDGKQWHKFYCQMTWAGGKAELAYPPQFANKKYIADAHDFIRMVAKHAYQHHDQFIAEAGAMLAAHASSADSLGRQVSALLNKGARWMDEADLKRSALFTTRRSPRSLQIGSFGPKQTPIFFDGNQSLVTIAKPSKGKSLSQVVPNLLTYPGSCVVLDVKDELWAMTAAHRERTFGKVYRYAPTDENGYSHRYNPFSLVPLTAGGAARECHILANQLIPDRPDAKDPYWERRGRAYLWALSMMIAFYATPETRNLASIQALLSIQTYFDDPKKYANSDTHRVVHNLEKLGQQLGLQDLFTAATSIYNGTQDTSRLESVFDTVRSFLAVLTQAPQTVESMKGSDWHPLDLRTKPGTTVYICLKPDELQAYAPLVRLVIQQHVSQLTRSFNPKPTDLPITFFMDELPQLGHMPAIAQLIEVGRGAGLRMWMFMQMVSQMKEVYKEKAMGLIEACHVRCYMSPDVELAKLIQPALGKTDNLFTGKSKFLAEIHELTGTEFADDIITFGEGHHPARLGKLWTSNDKALDALTQLPQPRIPLIGQPQQPGRIGHHGHKQQLQQHGHRKVGARQA
jgi:type IV secretion system protein VirD4